MLNFESDYLEGCHEKILQRLIETNLEKLSGYGADPYSENARTKIRQSCQTPDADIFFVAGGTLTNALVISSLLKNYEGVVAPKTGHIATHETGAIEFTGHKVLELAEENGKLTAEKLASFLTDFNADETKEFRVFPGMVYLSQPTEYGTLYSKAELEQIAAVCQTYSLPLFIDGARLGYALASPENDLMLAELAQLCDVFYIGGTKVGALLGEAVVFTKAAPEHFTAHLKQHGALLAKGRLLGLQFDTLFTDDLYLEISQHAIEMAYLLKKGLTQKGYQLLLDSPTNQQFFIVPNSILQKLKQHVAYTRWETYDKHQTVIRFATSWATKQTDVQQLIDLM